MFSRVVLCMCMIGSLSGNQEDPTKSVAPFSATWGNRFVGARSVITAENDLLALIFWIVVPLYQLCGYRGKCEMTPRLNDGKGERADKPAMRVARVIGRPRALKG